jgi:hypothetical protein
MARHSERTSDTESPRSKRGCRWHLRSAAQCATPSSPEQVFEIIGLVRDTKYYSPREKFLPIAFLSIDQDAAPDPFPQHLIRSSLPLAEATSSLRAVVARVIETSLN